MRAVNRFFILGFTFEREESELLVSRAHGVATHSRRSADPRDGRGSRGPICTEDGGEVAGEA
jgi:hypothetical protein